MDGFEQLTQIITRLVEQQSSSQGRAETGEQRAAPLTAHISFSLPEGVYSVWLGSCFPLAGPAMTSSIDKNCTFLISTEKAGSIQQEEICKDLENSDVAMKIK